MLKQDALIKETEDALLNVTEALGGDNAAKSKIVKDLKSKLKEEAKVLRVKRNEEIDKLKEAKADKTAIAKVRNSYAKQIAVLNKRITEARIRPVKSTGKVSATKDFGTLFELESIKKNLQKTFRP